MLNIEIAPKKYWLNESTYQEAILYCFSLDIDGKTGWRLPSVIEWFIANLPGHFQDSDYSRRAKCSPVRDIRNESR